MNVGERITFLREKKGITVNKLANLAGVSQSYLRDIELGKKQPTVEYLSYICEALGITLEYFFCDEKENDRIFGLIKELTPAQRKKLVEFIESII